MAFKVENIAALGGRVRLNLDLAPNPRISGGDILVNVTLINERDKIGIDGQMIIFSLGNVVYNIDDTKDEGKVSYNFVNLGPGTHAVYARLSGYPVLEVKATHHFPYPPVQKLTEPFIDALGNDGLYKITVQASYEGGFLAKNYPVKIVLFEFGKTPKTIDNLQTDDNGYLGEDIDFSTKECDVIVYVGQFKKELKNLGGPPTHPRSSIVPEPEEADLDKGIFRIILDAYKAGRENKISKRRRRE